MSETPASQGDHVGTVLQQLWPIQNPVSHAVSNLKRLKHGRSTNAPHKPGIAAHYIFKCKIPLKISASV